MKKTPDLKPADYAFNPNDSSYERLPEGWEKFESIYHPNGRKICQKRFPDGVWALIWLQRTGEFRSFRQEGETWHPQPLPGNHHPSRFTSIKRGCEKLDRELG